MVLSNALMVGGKVHPVTHLTAAEEHNVRSCQPAARPSAQISVATQHTGFCRSSTWAWTGNLVTIPRCLTQKDANGTQDMLGKKPH